MPIWHRPRQVFRSWILASTGEVIAHVAGRPTVDTGLALGGQVWDARYVDGEVLLTPRISSQVRDGFAMQRAVRRRALSTPSMCDAD